MQNSWIHVSKGRAARNARVGVREMNEEHVSRQGFFGPVAMLYHERPTADPKRIEGAISVATSPLEILATDTAGADDAATEILFNDALSISIVRRNEAMPYLFRNIDADTLYFIHAGTGTIATEFGPLDYEPGDFVLLQKGVTFRVMPCGPLTAMVVESLTPISLSEHRQVGRHSPIDPTVLVAPEPVCYDWPAQDEWALRLKHGSAYTVAYYDELPLDVIGWKGDLFPFKLNLRDIRPITSERFHLAPSSWAVFESSSFMGVVFSPMNIVSDPEAEELPSRHRNVDTEEAILLRSSNGIAVEMLMHMPQGLTHGPAGPYREAYEAVRRPGMRRMTDGVSIDAYARLNRTEIFQEAARKAGAMRRPLPSETSGPDQPLAHA